MKHQLEFNVKITAYPATQSRATFPQLVRKDDLRTKLDPILPGTYAAREVYVINHMGDVR